MTIQKIISTIAREIVEKDLSEGGFYIIRDPDGTLRHEYVTMRWDPLTEEGEKADCIFIPIPEISEEVRGVVEDEIEEYENNIYWAIMTGYKSWIQIVAAGKKRAKINNAKYSREKRIEAAKKAWRTKKKVRRE